MVKVVWSHRATNQLERAVKYIKEDQKILDSNDYWNPLLEWINKRFFLPIKSSRTTHIRAVRQNEQISYI